MNPEPSRYRSDSIPLPNDSTEKLDRLEAFEDRFDLHFLALFAQCA